MRRASNRKVTLPKEREIDVIAAELMKKISQEEPSEEQPKLGFENEEGEGIDKNRILSRAKALIKESKDSKKPAKKVPTRPSKADPFLTNILVSKSETRIQEEQREELIPQEFLNEHVDDSEVLKNLRELEAEDDLAELRRMINKTKSDITEFAGGVVNLKKIVDEAYKDSLNYGRKNMDDQMLGIDIKMEKLMPKGDANSLWKKKQKIAKNV